MHLIVAVLILRKKIIYFSLCCTLYLFDSPVLLIATKGVTKFCAKGQNEVLKNKQKERHARWTERVAHIVSNYLKNKQKESHAIGEPPLVASPALL